MIEKTPMERSARPPTLFRRAAIEGQRAKTLGDIVVVAPASFRLLSAAAGAVAAAIAAYLVWGTYTEHSTLAGRLVPESGVTGVHAPQAGIIVEKQVGEGDRVRRGDLLYVIANERLSSASGATQRLIGLELQRQRESLEAQMETTQALQETERAALLATIAALEQEAAGADAMIVDQQARTELAAQAARRYGRLREERFVAEEHYLARYQDWLEQRSRLQALERDRQAAARRLLETRARLQALPMTYENQMAELQRALATARRESLENEARRSLLVVAPRDGIATAVRGQVGQQVDPSTLLLSILPPQARLQAQLYAPSRAIGFINVGDEVLLRYDAYPYQKFGHHQGRVSAVSRTALSADELRRLGETLTESGPMYLVTVDLRSPTIQAYGVRRELQAGMTLEADVLHETRRLYEWVLDPLYTLTGRMH